MIQSWASLTYAVALPSLRALQVLGALSFAVVPARGMRPNARALAQAQQFRTNVVTGSVLLGFVGGVIFYVTRAISQDDINDAELEAFKAQRQTKAQPK